MIMDENEQDPHVTQQDQAPVAPVMPGAPAPTRENTAPGAPSSGASVPSGEFAASEPSSPTSLAAPIRPASGDTNGALAARTPDIPSVPSVPPMPPLPSVSVRATRSQPDQPSLPDAPNPARPASPERASDSVTSTVPQQPADTTSASQPADHTGQAESGARPSMLFPQTDDAQGQQADRLPAKPMFTPLPGTEGDDDNLEAKALWPSDPLESSASSKRTRGNRANADGHDGGVAGSDGRTPEASESSPANAMASGDSDLAVEGMDKGLVRLDPLAVHPRLSSRILCIVFALLLLAAAAGVWWLGVRTANGQNFDDEVWLLLNASLPSWLRSLVHLLAVSSTVIAISVVCALAGIVVAVIRKRWWLLGQLVVFAAVCYGSSLLKGVLPRPYLQNINSSTSNTAPSGHTLLAAAAVVVLVCAVPRVWRAACAAVGSVYVMLVALSLVAGKWHRPSDVVMSLLIVGGWALLVLAFTRTSGMDEIGTRSASASIQIVGSVMITGGIMLSLYGAYLVWQIEPGLSLGASWTQSGACVATTMLVCGVSMLVLGLVLAMRQLTASPLTKLGLVGAPPAPPSK